VWWLSLDGKLSLPFNEPDALQLVVAGSKNLPSGSLDMKAGLLALEPRLLLLAAAGHYEASGRMARDLDDLVAWLERVVRLQQASFAPIRQRRRRLLLAVQRRRESYLRHVRRQSDHVELRRQLQRLLRDCAQYPGTWKAGRLVKRWCSRELLEQLAQLQASDVLQAVFWPRNGEAATREESADSVTLVSCPRDLQYATRGSESSALASNQLTAAAPAGTSEPSVAGMELQASRHQAAELGATDFAQAMVPGRDAFERLLQAEKLAALRQLAYGASHEINNPLANIAMRAEILLRGETNEDRQRKLQVIRQQAMRAHEMISDLMLFANPPRPNLEEIDFGKFLRQLAAELQTDVSLVGAALQVESDCLGSVVVDPGQLAEVVRALVRNSLEAQTSGAQITIRAGMTTLGEAWVEVVDNGPGITAEVARHMFDPFYSSREAGRGLGFGLSKAWRIAESHGGRLECLEQAPGTTRFRFQWPRLARPAQAA
jgi:hypothetical protein